MRTLRISITFMNSAFFPQGALSAVGFHNN